MSDTAPLVSVLLPVYNGEPYLRAAIESVLNQSYSNFELIILNDGSRDDSQLTINAFAGHPRIRAYQHPNRGLPATLNRGIELAEGELIARMDQDDLAAPERLSKQVAYLNSNSNVVLLGTSYRIIDSDGKPLGIRYQLCDPLQVQRQIYIGNPFCHGSVIFRREAVAAVGYYDPSAIVEDYDLWRRIYISRIGEMANLKDVLYDYRVNVNTSMVATNRQRYRYETDMIRRSLWGEGSPPSVFEQRLSLDLTSGALIAGGSHNRTQRYLHLVTGLAIARTFRNNGDIRRAVKEWCGLCFLHCTSPTHVVRLLRHLPSLLLPQREVTIPS